MPDDTDISDIISEIVVRADRLDAARNEISHAFGNMWKADAFQFASFGGIGGGNGGGGGSGSGQNTPQTPPEDEGPEIVVPGERDTDGSDALTNREFMDAIRTILDNLDATDFGDYKLDLDVGSARLTIFDHWRGMIDTYYLSTTGASVFSEPDPQPEVFDLPPGFRPSGPQFDFDFHDW